MKENLNDASNASIMQNYYEQAKKIIDCKKCKGAILKISKLKRGKNRFPNPAYIGDNYEASETRILFIVHTPKIGLPDPSIVKNYKDVKKQYLGEMKNWNTKLHASLVKLSLCLSNDIGTPDSLKKYYKTHKNVSLVENFAWTNIVKCDIAKAKKEFGSSVKNEMYKECPNRFFDKDIEILKPHVIILCGVPVREEFSRYEGLEGLPADLVEYTNDSVTGEAYNITYKNKEYLCGIMGHPYHPKHFNDESIVKLGKEIRNFMEDRRKK